MNFVNPRHGRGKGVLLTVAALVLALVAAVGFAVLYTVYNKETTKTCTVTSKSRTQKYDSSSGRSSLETRVYTRDCGVFRVEDAPHKGKFRSGDVFGQLEDNHTYNITYYGWRVGVTSSFPNIIRASEVTR